MEERVRRRVEAAASADNRTAAAGVFARAVASMASSGAVRPGTVASPAPAAALVFVGWWGRLQLLLGSPAAVAMRDVAAMCCVMALMARLAVFLGYSAAVMTPLVQLLGLCAMVPVLADPKAARALLLILTNRPASADPRLERAPPRVRFEVRPLVEAPHFLRAADLLASAAVVGGTTAADWLRALVAACDGSSHGALPQGCVLLEAFAAETPPGAQRAPAASSWSRPAGDAAPPAPATRSLQPNRLLGLLLARVVPSVDIHTLGNHPLLPDNAPVVLCEVPLLGLPGWFSTQGSGQSPWRAASLTADACAHLARRLGCAAAIMPATCGGMPSPFSSLALSTRGAHALKPALGGPQDTYLLCIPPPLVGCGSLTAFAREVLSSSQRKALRVRRKRFLRAGGSVMTVRPDALAADEQVMRMLTTAGQQVVGDSSKEQQAVVESSGDGDAGRGDAPAALVSVLSPPSTGAGASANGGLAHVMAAMAAMAAPAEATASIGAPDALKARAAIQPARRSMFALSARVGGTVAGAALVVLDRSTGVMWVAHHALNQPLARTSGASAALSTGLVELALVHGALAVDLGPHPAAAKQLGAALMPRTPFILFADDRLAASKPPPAALYSGLLRYSMQLRRAPIAGGGGPDEEANPLSPSPSPPVLSNKRRKRLHRKALKAGRAAEAARQRDAEDRTVAAAVEADDVASFKEADAATVISSDGAATLAGLDVDAGSVSEGG